jgi:hypothetical protein
MRKKISVTEDHIKKGRHGNGLRYPVVPMINPVTVAIREAFPESVFSVAFTSGISIDYGGVSYCLEPSRSVARFIERFRARKEVKPFSFYLDIPGDEP